MQEVPETERKGRVHTSTVVVAVLDPACVRHDPKLDQRDSKDYRLEWYSGSGSGGQNRNRKQNCCRIVHVPTGITKTAQTRDRTNSERLAMEAITASLDELRADQAGTGAHLARRAQTGSGQRGDKRRTYRFQDGHVTDHITGKRAPVEKVMRGNFDLLT